MMNKQLKKTLVLALLLFLPNLIFSQVLDLGALTSFAAFTESGNVTGPGTSGTVLGDVGTNSGTLGRFATSYNGNQYNSNGLTLEARIDLLRVYIHLFDIFVDYPNTHTPSFGGGDTLTPGIYSIDGAGSIAGTLTLNGGGDSNAVFIVKLDGAITASANTTINLTGGTRACNVFWIAEGAIYIGANSVIKGSLFSHFGVVSFGTNCTMDGRILAAQGITMGGGSDMAIPSGPISIPTQTTNTRPPAAAVDVLRSIEGFVLFSSVGAVSNSASSGFVGHIGSDVGAVSGFTSSTVIGYRYNTDSITAQAELDLDTAYTKLDSIPVTDSTHAATFGAGDTLTAGVYSIAGAGSLSGFITLDAQNDQDAVFIFKFGGAFTVAAQTTVVFINKTRMCNVFWIAEGAISMAAHTNMKGTMIANNAACSMAANSHINGRMLSTGGAVSVSTCVAYCEPLYFTPYAYLPVDLISFTGEVEGDKVRLKWTTTNEINNAHFTVEHSTDGTNFNSVNKISGAGNSTQISQYSTVHYTPTMGKSYYRLKQTDYDGKTNYSDQIAVTIKTTDDLILNISPNPFSNVTTISSNQNFKNASLIVYSSYKTVKTVEHIYGQSFSLYRDNLRAGMYWIRIVEDGKVLGTEKIIITD
jgi:hypothetical protein